MVILSCHKRQRPGAGDRLVKYGDVRTAYPNYRFPRGTFGWEPATRTVNGGPGFDALPKPKPRPSRWAHALKFYNAVMVKGVGDFLAGVLKILSSRGERGNREFL